MRVRLRSKLLLGVLIYLLLLGGVGLAGVYAAQVSLDSIHTVVEHHVRQVSLVGELAADVNLLQSDLLLHTLGRSPEEEHAYEQQVVQLEQRVNALVDDLLQIQVQFEDGADIERLHAFRAAWDQFVSVKNEKYLPLSRQGRDDEVFQLAQPDGALGQALADVRTQLVLLQAALPAQSTARVQDAERDFAVHRDGLIVTLILAGAIGVMLALAQMTQLAQAIEALSQAAWRVAQGNFGQRVRVETGDELERLADSFNLMTSELQRMRDEQHAVERMKNEFVSMVSHELRTPMNGVIGMTTLLLRRNLGRQEREYAEAAQRSGEALLAIINDILDLSKIEAGRLELTRGPVDVRAVVEDVTVLLAPQAQAKGIEIAWLVDASVPRELVGDVNRLRQILLNLVGNAVKFTDVGEVLVRARAAESAGDELLVRFEVADTGIGIRPEASDSLFRTFSQVDDSMRRRAGGTGLGLAISRRLAELMGGTVGFESEAGRGSTFWAIARFAHPAQPAAALHPSPAELRGRRVLVVDDNAAAASMLVQHLLALEVNAELALDGAGGLARLATAATEGDAFDLALVDRMLPDMDGLAFAHQVAADPLLAGSRVILLNLLGENARADDLAAAGVSATLEKPVRHARLVETLTRVLRGAADQLDGLSTGEGAASLPSPRPATGAIPRVLLVEDVPMSRRVAAAMLRDIGLEVDVAANGREALEILDMHLDDAPYVVILMDCQMPEMDGFETTAAIRQRDAGYRDIPIIAMTADAMRGNRDRCLAAGMDDYLAKPLRFEALETALHRWLPDRVADAQPLTGLVNWAAVAELGRQLDRSGAGDGGALADMIAEFRVEATSRIHALRQAAESKDGPGLRIAAHSLRGPAATLGAVEVEALAADLERLAGERTPIGADALIDSLQAAVERASMALEEQGAMPATETRCAS
jgi:signal transduction histidine kinase/CheY-like chemotaxis protein/HPt (histidine-containing phosphotransfer) domain-containing protein